MPTSGALYAVQFVDCIWKLQIIKQREGDEWRKPVGMVGGSSE